LRWSAREMRLTRRHIHLHVISSDRSSDCLKTKKHFNSFRPDLGFFIPIAEVERWIANDRRYVEERVDVSYNHQPASIRLSIVMMCFARRGSSPVWLSDGLHFTYRVAAFAHCYLPKGTKCESRFPDFRAYQPLRPYSITLSNVLDATNYSPTCLN
jgi:hypothetical protein